MTRLNRRAPSCARRAFTYVDLIVVVCLIPIFAIGCYMSGGRSRETANRVKCASNLRQMGQAMILYANDNHGAFPRGRTSADAVKKPVYGTGAPATQPTDADGPADNDVTAAVFLLLRTQDLTSEVFTCPSSNAEKDLYEGQPDATKRSNFTKYPLNLSYSMQNPYANDSAVQSGWAWNNQLSADYAVAADVNPGTKGSGDNVLKPNKNSSAKEMRFANSNNHDKDGQNILYGDGHVSWESNPFVGVKLDNIYTTADGKTDASPVDNNDSILVPTDD